MSSRGESASSRWTFGSALSPGLGATFACRSGILPSGFFTASSAAGLAGEGAGFVAGVAGFSMGLAVNLISGFFFVTGLATGLAFCGFVFAVFFSATVLCAGLAGERAFVL
jgi:hypothetical protein